MRGVHVHISTFNAITPRLATRIVTADETGATILVQLDRELSMEVFAPRPPGYIVSSDEWRRKVAAEPSTRTTLRQVRLAAIPHDDVIKSARFAVVSVQVDTDLWLTVADNNAKG